LKYRVLGKSGLKVSEVSLGCWAIGGPSWLWIKGLPSGWTGNDDAESLKGLRRAYDLGINHLDTADVYGDGHSERLIGKFLKEVPRDRVVVASKAGWFKGTSRHAFHPLHLRHQLEQTLDNLGTDHVDIYYFHHADFGESDAYLSGAAEIVHRAKKEGKVRAVGQSAYSFDEFSRVAPATRPEVIQFEYNALDATYDAPGSDLFAWAESQNLGIVLFSPFAKGLLLDKYDPENPPRFGEGDVRGRGEGWTRETLLELKEKLKAVKARYGTTTADLARAALKYCLARSPLAVAIPGFKNAAQVEANAAASGGPAFTADDLAFIRSALKRGRSSQVQ